jgi:hypothetical protein
MTGTAPKVPIEGLLQLLASVRLPSSAWPLPRVALAAGSTPPWLAEGRAVPSALLSSLLSSVGCRTTPAVSLKLANIVLHEKLTADLLAGSLLIMAGVACAAFPNRRTA